MKIAFAAMLVVVLAACSPTAQNDGSATPSTGSTTVAAPTTVTLPAANAATALAKYHWQLANAMDKSGQRIDTLFARADQPLQLDFTAHGIAISNTCNRMRASYSTADNRIRIGALAATLMACPDAKLDGLDKAAARYFSGTFVFAVGRDTPPTLTLTTSTGDLLVFDGVPTAATRFGNGGTTAFLEVAPETKPCNHPLMPNAQCLEVRAVHYGANGIREGEPGPWQTLGQDIEGYTHEPGVRNVLRVQRYKISNPPADASSVAYVLDMVIESASPPGKKP